MSQQPETPAEDNAESAQSGTDGTAAYASTIMSESQAGFTEELAAARPLAEHLEPARILARVKQSLLDMPSAPQRLGRFLVIDRLGQGGMGVVYSAYDPELDRKVALKLLRASRHNDAARDRLKREAQALAKLSHSNVVPVHDVAVIDDQVVVVMEFVKGVTLRQWLARESPDWRAILRVYLDAARGLAAAHRAGIVHRDFKPDNVLAGDDGRVRVVDFGLARASNRPPNSPSEESADELDGDPASAVPRSCSLDSDLTQAGTVLGTPAYMSPEQRDGRPTDHPTDQYSFCVSLHEGLYGVRPQDVASAGPGDSISHDTGGSARRRAATLTGERPVPGWLHPILARGLADEPDERWPSIDALIAALADDPVERRRRRRRTALRTLALLAVVLGLGWLAWRGGQQADTERQRKRIAEVERDEARIDLADELRRSRDAARILAVESLRRDPTQALSILREVEDPERAPRWAELAAVALRKPVAQRILTGDGKEVLKVAFSPDGAHLAAASLDGTVRVWSLAGDQAPRTITGHSGRPAALLFSPDGQRIATASADGTARIVALQKDHDPVVLRGHDGPLHSAVFSPDGTRLATVGEDATARIWSSDGSGTPTVLGGHAQRVYAVAFSPQGDLVATSSADGTARLWTPSGREVAILDGHTAPVRRIAFSPDGSLLATGSRDRTVRLWRVSDAALATGFRPQPPRVLTGHNNAINTLKFSPDGSLLATGSTDRTVRLWHINSSPDASRASLSDPIVLTGHEGFVSAVAFSTDGQQLVSSSADGTARVWNTDGRKDAIVLRGHQGFIVSAVFAPDAPLVATGSMDTTVRLWRVPPQPAQRSLEGHTGLVLNAAFSPDGARVVTASFDKTARIWTTDGHDPPTVITGHTDHVRWVQFSPDGTRVVTASTDKTARIYHLLEGTSTALVGHTGIVSSADFSPDGTQVVTTSTDRTVRVWGTARDTDDQRAPNPLTEHADMVLYAVFSPSGSSVLSVSASAAHITKLAGDRPPIVLQGAGLRRETVSFSPDGRHVALAAGTTVKLRDADSGAQTSTLAGGHAAAVTSLAFSGDGSRLVTGSLDRTAVIWDVANARVIATLRGHRDAIITVAFSPEGQRVLTSSADLTARVWSADGRGHPVVLAGHQSEITTARFSPHGHTALTTATDGSVILWRSLTPTSSLTNMLWRATDHCMPVELRRDLLGSSQQIARADRDRCRKRVRLTSSGS